MTLDIIVKQKDSNGDIILDEQGNPIIIEENHHLYADTKVGTCAILRQYKK